MADEYMALLNAWCVIGRDIEQYVALFFHLAARAARKAYRGYCLAFSRIKSMQYIF